MMSATPYFSSLRHAIARLGGLYNAHLHLDRAGTLDDCRLLTGADAINDMAHVSLAEKHQTIPAIHASRAYEPENLAARVNHYLDLMVEAGTTRAETFVDVTWDKVGLSALRNMAEIRDARRSQIDLKLGAYSPLGFKDSEPERWDVLREGAAIADFIGSLPERDDHRDYPEHIGFDEHCRRMLKLAADLRKPVHIHVDQRNDPAENGAERVLAAVDECGIPEPVNAEPMLWLIHVISPSTYDEARFHKFIGRLAENNIGVICCPSAALSMRQLRSVRTPASNSIARVLEMLAAGIHVRIGSDNINDIASPAGTADLVDEVFVLCNAVRFYDPGILAKIAAGLRLNSGEREIIRKHLEYDAGEVARTIGHYGG